MIEFFIVLSFYLPNGALVKQTSNSLPTIEACEKLLAYDLKQRVDAHGNATGYCLAAPEKPDWIKDAPQQGPRRSDV